MCLCALHFANSPFPPAKPVTLFRHTLVGAAAIPPSVPQVARAAALLSLGTGIGYVPLAREGKGVMR